MLLAWGLSDKYLPQSVAEEFQKGNPQQIKLKLIEGAGHMPQEDWWVTSKSYSVIYVISLSGLEYKPLQQIHGNQEMIVNSSTFVLNSKGFSFQVLSLLNEILKERLKYKQWHWSINYRGEIEMH